MLLLYDHRNDLCWVLEAEVLNFLILLLLSIRSISFCLWCSTWYQRGGPVNFCVIRWLHLVLVAFAPLKQLLQCLYELLYVCKVVGKLTSLSSSLESSFSMFLPSFSFAFFVPSVFVPLRNSSKLK